MGSHRESASARNAQLVRILGVLRDLDRLGGVDLYELAERYGTTVRTIRRDLDAIQEVGLPLVEEQQGKRKRWRVAYKTYIQKLSALLDASHYLALRVAMGHEASLRSTLVFEALADLSDKIEQAVGPHGRAQLAAVQACFLSNEKFAYQSSAPDVLWPLVAAIGDRRVCVVRYRTPGSAPRGKLYRILPLRLFAHDGAVYLFAWVPRYRNVILLNLRRLRQLKPLNEHATPPKDFDPNRWLSSAFELIGTGKPVRYVLRFQPAIADYIRERKWHDPQRLRELKGGGVELSFESPANSYEVASWVASWRDGVEVLEPPALRRDLLGLGRSLQSRYGSAARHPRNERAVRARLRRA
jgi:predicted DNA-binding transcriptional regulator YafY